LSLATVWFERSTRTNDKRVGREKKIGRCQTVAKKRRDEIGSSDGDRKTSAASNLLVVKRRDAATRRDDATRRRDAATRRDDATR
jgi:hypothetical protein